MTGCMLTADDFCLVIAEGSLKSHKKYNRLMLNRIDWNQTLEDEQQGQPWHLSSVMHIARLDAEGTSDSTQAVHHNGNPL